MRESSSSLIKLYVNEKSYSNIFNPEESIQKDYIRLQLILSFTFLKTFITPFLSNSKIEFVSNCSQNEICSKGSRLEPTTFHIPIIGSPLLIRIGDLSLFEWQPKKNRKRIKKYFDML